jgi:hypothetical protein
MTSFKKSAKAWGSESFKSTLLEELSQLDSKHLPLQQGLASSSVALDDDVKFMILNIEANEPVIEVKLGIFYYGIIAGCNCADDPTPADKINEYCETLLKLDLNNAQGSINLLS